MANFTHFNVIFEKTNRRCLPDRIGIILVISIVARFRIQPWRHRWNHAKPLSAGSRSRKLNWHRNLAQESVKQIKHITMSVLLTWG